MKTTAERLKWARERAGFAKASDFARHVNVNTATYRSHERNAENNGRSFSYDVARAYGTALGVSASWLLTGVGDPVPDSESGDSSNITFLTEPDPAPLTPPSNVDTQNIRTDGLVGPRDLPVYSSAAGGAGAVILTYEPVEFVKRPEPLMNAKGGFAFYLIGSSMEPVINHGDMVLVHPSRPPMPNKQALFVKSDENSGSTEAIVKTLVSWDDKVWRVRQYNPAQNFDLARTEWNQAYLIVGKYDGR